MGGDFMTNKESKPKPSKKEIYEAAAKKSLPPIKTKLEPPKMKAPKKNANK